MSKEDIHVLIFYGEYEFLPSGNMIQNLTWKISIVSFNCLLLTVSFSFAVVGRFYFFFLPETSPKYDAGLVRVKVSYWACRSCPWCWTHSCHTTVGLPHYIVLWSVVCDKDLGTSHVHSQRHTSYNPRRDSFPSLLTYIAVLLNPLHYLYTWQDVKSRREACFQPSVGVDISWM